MVSCLASRSGTKSDSFAIDYQATLNCLETAKKEGAAHFVMLSAFCVKNPILQVPQSFSAVVFVGVDECWMDMSAERFCSTRRPSRG